MKSSRVKFSIAVLAGAISVSTAPIVLAGVVAPAPLSYGAVGYVHASFADDSGGDSATGVLINNSGLFLTNIHVIVPCLKFLGEKDEWKPTQKVVGQNCPGGIIEISFPMAQGQPHTSGAKIVALGRTLSASKDAPIEDWVILQLNSNESKSLLPAKLSPRDLLAGEDIRFAGFPIEPVGRLVDSHSKMYESVGKIESLRYASAAWLTIYKSLKLTELQLFKIFLFTHDNYLSHSSMFYHNAPIMAGYSGSPVFDDSGSLVGLIWGGISTWDSSFGDFPEALGYDPKNPSKLANRLSAGIKIKDICAQSLLCKSTGN